ncbi:MAG: NUDIX hydrolase [Acidimicrobiia bacterium]|jgi:8-oxo-dGTP diphosphatase
MTVRERLHQAALGLYRRLPVQARRRVVRSLTPGFTVGAMGIIERPDGALLLVRLSYRQRWGVPGGLLKRGETPEDAVRREIREEVGLDVVLVGEPAVVVAAEPRRVDVIFRARPAPGEDPDRATPSSPEIVAVSWFPADALPELQHETSGALVALARSSRAPQAVPLPEVERDRSDR